MSYDCFCKNKIFIGLWISGFRRHCFYLALMNYVSAYSLTPLAVLLISLSETLPQLIQVFTGVAADFQKNRIHKYLLIQFSKVLLYSLTFLAAWTSEAAHENDVTWFVP